MEVGLSLGSNLGDRKENMRSAMDMISHLESTLLEAVSPLYETDPVDVRPEHMDMSYLNAFAVISSGLELEILSRLLHDIEERLERRRSADRNAPRPIDIDLIYADAVRIDKPTLHLPHPRWRERRFVVQPMADLRPDLILPGADHPVIEVLEKLPDTPSVKLVEEDWYHIQISTN